MLLKILIILPMISICVDSIAPDNEPKHAVSTQSFHRDDVPLSYKYSSVHIYTTPQPEQRPGYHRQENTKYNTIQYAPLEHQSDIHRHKHIPDRDEQNFSPIVEQYTQYSTEGNRRDHLEPRLVAENLEAHNQNYRSYVPGHNVEVLQSNHVYGHSDYRTLHKNFQDQKVKIPKFVILRKKPEQQVQTTSVNFGPPEQRPLSEEDNILYTFLPKPNDNTQHNAYAIKSQKSFNQALYAKIPRLHLNIARVYGLAHIHPQAPDDIPRPNVGKPPSHTQAIFIPLKAPVQQKTILYPVQDVNKNHPLQSY